jgi:GGDEF domain-containing protein
LLADKKLDASEPRVNLSLSSWMKQLDSTDSYLDCALDCYKGAIASIRANLVVSTPTLKREISGRLDRLAATVSRRTAVDMLRLTSTRLDEILTEHRVSEEAVYQEEQIQLRKTLTALEDLVKSVSTRASERSEQLNEVLQNLEAALFEGDLSTTHRILQEQIRKLRTCLVTISEDRQCAESALQDNLSTLRSQTQDSPVSNEVTADPPSAEVNAVLNTYITTYTLFSLVLCKVNDMAQLASHWNAEARAELIASVESRLAANAGPSDRTHSWAEGEFVVIMRSTLARAMDEASKIKNILSAPYEVPLPYGTAQIRIEVSAGAVEYVPGEDVASLMGRAELAAIRDREPLLSGDEESRVPEVAA